MIIKIEKEVGDNEGTTAEEWQQIIDNFQASSLDSSQFYDREVKKKILATIEEEPVSYTHLRDGMK